MTTFTELQIYRHDITGKFNDVTEVINSITDANISTAKSIDRLHAAHEALLKMISTSRGVLLTHAQSKRLILTNDLKRKDQTVSLPNGIDLNVEINQGHINYFTQALEYQDLRKKIILASHFLPITSVSTTNLNSKIVREVQEICASFGLQYES